MDAKSDEHQVRSPRVTVEQVEKVRSVTLRMDEETALWLYNLSHSISMGTKAGPLSRYGDLRSAAIAEDVCDALAELFGK